MQQWVMLSQPTVFYDFQLIKEKKKYYKFVYTS